MEGARGYDGMIRVRRVQGPTLEVACTDELSGGTLQRIASSCISPLMQELAICIYNLGSQRIPQLQRATSSVGPTRRAGDDTIRNHCEKHR